MANVRLATPKDRLLSINISKPIQPANMMKKKVFLLMITSALWLPIEAANDMRGEEVTKTSEVVDQSSTPLKFRTLSDSTAAVNKDESYKMLQSVTIPAKVRIDDRVYAVTSIGHETFAGCEGLTDIELPSTLTYIGMSAFSSCIGLKKITIPSRVTTIEEYAFSNCKGLTSINIPASVAKIGNTTFLMCKELSSINVAVDNPYFTNEGGILYDHQKTTIICVPCQTKGIVTLPSSVTSIRDHCFFECEELAGIKLPESITRIEDYAFKGCKKLKSIEIPASVTEIGYGAFSRCESLTNVKIPTSVTSIASEAFSWCVSLKSIKIPTSVTSISTGAFMGCVNLKEINIPSGVTSIEPYTFDGCKSLSRLELSANVTKVKGWAFRGCNDLTLVIDHAEGHIDFAPYVLLDCKSVEYTKGELPRVKPEP